MTSPSDRIMQVQAVFKRDIAKHEMNVLRDDGLYRHLRCQRPETWSYGFDIVTWPGHLAISGDMGCYVFARLLDMFEFFETRGGINPHYWSEKLEAPRGRDAVRAWSADRFRQRVLEWQDEVARQLDPADATGFRQAVANELLLHAGEGEPARAALQYFAWHDVTIDDWWEWELSEYQHQFLWCCWAIPWAIRKYEARVAVHA